MLKQRFKVVKLVPAMSLTKSHKRRWMLLHHLKATELERMMSLVTNLTMEIMMAIVWLGMSKISPLILQEMTRKAKVG